MRGTVGEDNLSAVAAARVSAALNHIAACFHEPPLNSAVVASKQGISLRYLQHLMESSGTAFTERVNQLRLQAASKLLTETRGSRRRVSDTELQVGFSDVSYFNRLFRSRFGDTPSAVRAQGRRSRSRRTRSQRGNRGT